MIGFDDDNSFCLQKQQLVKQPCVIKKHVFTLRTTEDTKNKHKDDAAFVFIIIRMWALGRKALQCTFDLERLDCDVRTSIRYPGMCVWLYLYRQCQPQTDRHSPSRYADLQEVCIGPDLLLLQHHWQQRLCDTSHRASYLDHCHSKNNKASVP